METLLLIGLGIMSVVTIIGIFITKTPGFGRFSTSVLILALVLFISAFLLVSGKLESSIFANVIFAVTGYAGGLINAKKAQQNGK